MGIQLHQFIDLLNLDPLEAFVFIQSNGVCVGHVAENKKSGASYIAWYWEGFFIQIKFIDAGLYFSLYRNYESLYVVIADQIEAIGTIGATIQPGE